MSNKKIYVGNLTFSTTTENLKETFSQYGEIEEAIIISDRDTGRSKGFGFITFTTEEGMTASLEQNGQDLDGRPLKVNEAQERKPRERRY